MRNSIDDSNLLYRQLFSGCGNRAILLQDDAREIWRVGFRDRAGAQFVNRCWRNWRIFIRYLTIISSIGYTSVILEFEFVCSCVCVRVRRGEGRLVYYYY